MTREDKWKQNYIENLDLQNITWLTLEKDDFLKFINQNYFDEELGEYVIGEDPEIPFGMHYVADIQNQSTKYLLGIVPNSIQKFTIFIRNCPKFDSEIHHRSRLYVSRKLPFLYQSNAAYNLHRNCRNQSVFSQDGIISPTLRCHQSNDQSPNTCRM